MKDEMFVYQTEQREKSSTARSARSKRTHCGRGGCNLPSDYMTKKEKEAMNGDCVSYRLNEPMTYQAFKGMPFDIQTSYIKALQNHYGVTAADIAEMMGTASSTLCGHCRKFLPDIRFTRGYGVPDLKKDEWDAFVKSGKVDPTEWVNIKDDCEQQIREKSETIDALMDQYHNLEKEIEHLKFIISCREKELSESYAKQKDLERELREKEEDPLSVNVLSKELDEAHSLCDELNNSVENLTAERNYYKAQVDIIHLVCGVRNEAR